MTNEELKKKICKIIADNYLPKEMPDRLEDYKLYRFKRAAEALIAAGIGDVKEEKFEADHYWNMWQGALVELERAERRAKIAERALKVAADLGELCAPAEDYIEQAEKELQEEGKDEQS